MMVVIRFFDVWKMLARGKEERGVQIPPPSRTHDINPQPFPPVRIVVGRAPTDNVLNRVEVDTVLTAPRIELRQDRRPSWVRERAIQVSPLVIEIARLPPWVRFEVEHDDVKLSADGFELFEPGVEAPRHDRLPVVRPQRASIRQLRVPVGPSSALFAVGGRVFAIQPYSCSGVVAARLAVK